MTDDNFYSPGSVSWMHDIKGFHKIGNPTSERAVTLHVYSPPYKAANCVSLTGEKMSCSITYDTVGGVKTEPSDKCCSTTAIRKTSDITASDDKETDSSQLVD